MKNRNKIILGAALALSPIAIVTPLILTSCANTNNYDPLADTYQTDYSKQISLFLDKDKKAIVKKQNDTGGYSLTQQCVFRDREANSQTYDGWYLLMRDTITGEIFASFVGWDYAYLRNSNKPDVVKNGFTLPLSVQIPGNISVEGLDLNSRIPIKALGYGREMMIDLIGNLNQLSGLFPDNGLSNANNFTKPMIPVCEIFDLKETNVKYIFEMSMSVEFILKTQKTVIFPRDLIYLNDPVNTTTNTDNLTLDLSYTNLIEIKEIWTVNRQILKIILPESCKRITQINCDNLSINLENVLYYGEGSMRSVELSINGSTNKVVINKNSNFWDDSFPNGYEVVDSLGNKLEPTNKSNY